MMKKFLAQAYIWLLLIILYAPIVIIAVFSFTEAKVMGNWTGFSTNLYSSLFTGGINSSLITAIINTISIALIAAMVSTALGTVAAIGIHNLRGWRRQAITFVNNIPMMNPDIITGISLFILFVTIGLTQGYLTVVLAHISFCTPYVVLSVMPRLTQMNPNVYEAALDLGATPMQALRKVIIPDIKPGMISGFILSFTLSIDDFAVTLFTKGNQGLETLSTYIYADARKGGLTPELRPLMTIIIFTVLLLLIIINIRSLKINKKLNEKNGKKVLV
ncbi:MAG: ABC transporter permease [Bacteroidales bacterium]|nr:ABC transporter permease [Candidatus Cacconaster caballi]